MIKPIHLCASIFLFSTLSSPTKATHHSDQPSERLASWYQFTFENDAMSAINNSDDGYSNGMMYNWGHSDYRDFSSIKMPSWLRYISDWTFINQGINGQYSIAYGLSQAMYTPDEIGKSELLKNDRPYAGTLLWHSKVRNFAENRANSLGLVLGVAGPASFAEQSQTVIHTLIDATIPQGWDNQINNELVFRVEAEHIERFYNNSFSNHLSFDAISYSEAGLGNLRSDIGTGLTIRFGNMLDQTYATINPNTSRIITSLGNTSKNKFYWQAYSAFYASYVFNDITLNGNTFSNSHSIELINEQLMASFGIAASYAKWGLVFSIHRGNEQFEGQVNVSKYGSLTMSYHY